MIRSMMKEKGFPNIFGNDVVYTVVYILNRCPSKENQDKTPIQILTDKKQLIKHLRVFRCICYIHVLNQKRHKLKDKTIKGIFLWYSAKSKD